MVYVKLAEYPCKREAEIIRKEYSTMKKEYESPLCKIVTVEKKDIITTSPTTNKFVNYKTGVDGDYSGGAYVGWNSNLWG